MCSFSLVIAFLTSRNARSIKVSCCIHGIAAYTATILGARGKPDGSELSAS